MASTADLRAWLSSLPPHELERVVSLRSESLAGAPVRDLDDLAERLSDPSSVAAALVTLPTPHAQVLETLVACGAGASTGRAAELMQSSGDDDGPLGAVSACVADLVQAALVWPAAAEDDDGAPSTGERVLAVDTPLEVNPGVSALVSVPWGLGRPFESIAANQSADALKRILRAWGRAVPARRADVVRDVARHLADPRNVRMLVAGAAPGHAEVLIRNVGTATGDLARRSPAALRDHDDDPFEEEPLVPFDQAAYRLEQGALGWARDHGLVYPPYGSGLSTFDLEFPSEVVLALLPADVRMPFQPSPPAAATVPVTADHVVSAASGAVTESLSLTMSVLESLDRTPIAVLKAGGIGAREIARLAKNLGSDTAGVRLALELAAALRLLEHSLGGGMGTSPRFRDWRRLEPAERAADLAIAWMAAAQVPTQDRTDDGKARPALEPAWEPRATALRGLLLAEARDLEGVGLIGPEAFAETAAWRLPYLAWGRFREDALATWDESHRLGVLGLGTLTGPGSALVEIASDQTPDRAHGRLLEALRSMLPATQATALFGSDLTVVVPGSPAPEAVDLLDTVARREARGSAATWRISPESIRRAMDEGHAADALLQRLQALSEGALPQALEYLIRDVARRHGHVGVQPGSAVVVGEDPGLLAEIAAHRSLRNLGLRQVAPTVLVAQVPQDELLHALRAAGYLPVPLDATGARTLPHPVHASVAAPTRRTRQEAADPGLRMLATVSPVAEPPSEEPADLAARLLRGDTPPTSPDETTLAGEIGRSAQRLSRSQIGHLAHAIATGGAVIIRYRASSGGITERTISEMSLIGDFIYAWCHLRSAERYFALKSILSVTGV